eukprot:TRINITY_DN6967_c0_g1_i3.p1 TRINITY_DN6967_c0_g1~~TRINITY_DN6967_c0_g1_i3.p1  ORF type:complete len:257 (+),score=40.40 TRINITY_DN6967_c0_g1_i3:267-1037(+)
MTEQNQFLQRQVSETSEFNNNLKKCFEVRYYKGINERVALIDEIYNLRESLKVFKNIFYIKNQTLKNMERELVLLPRVGYNDQEQIEEQNQKTQIEIVEQSNTQRKQQMQKFQDRYFSQNANTQQRMQRCQSLNVSKQTATSKINPLYQSTKFNSNEKIFQQYKDYSSQTSVNYLKNENVKAKISHFFNIEDIDTVDPNFNPKLLKKKVNQISKLPHINSQQKNRLLNNDNITAQNNESNNQTQNSSIYDESQNNQ